MILSSFFIYATLAFTSASPSADTPRELVFDTHGRPADPSYFPVAVWLQDPRNAPKYKAAGINLYVGLWRGPTAGQLDALKAAGMPVVCSQNRLGLQHKDNPTIAAWMHGDEPDNAQPVTDPKTGRRGYGPPVKPATIEADYHKLRQADASRPVLLNLGQGVANDAWKGRGPGARLDDYPGYVRGADIVSFDVYPVAGLARPKDLQLVAKGVKRLTGWAGPGRPVWSCIECTHISDADHQATPAQVKAEVWMALTHGATGLIYFVHQFKPKFNEHALLDDHEMLAAVTRINEQIRALAPVLNAPTVTDALTVTTAPATAPLAAMVKRHAGATYVFTVGMTSEPTSGRFQLAAPRGRATAEVLGEDRAIEVNDGAFGDSFKPYEVHLYKIAAPGR